MKIEGPKMIELRHANPGEVVLFLDDFFLVTDESQDDWQACTHLRSGLIERLPNRTSVQPVKATLHVE